jgi:hypothetical protein
VASPLQVPSLLPGDSILQARATARRASRRPLFSLRSQVDSGRSLVRLVDSDGDAGTARVGFEYELEPTDEEESAIQPPLPPPVPSIEPGISKNDLKGEAVPIDGAAKQAEESDQEKEDGPATNRSSFGWIAGTGNQLGMLEWVSRDLAVMDYNAADRASFRIQGGHAFTWLNGPETTDLPPYLFSLFVEVGAGTTAGNWAFDVVVSPSWNTDFANKSYTLFRLPWQAVSTYKLGDEWKLVLGVLDLDREDIQFLPIAGLVYKPLDDSMHLDLVFPRPKAAWRLGPNDDGHLWAYVAGELGGNSYSIQRPGAIHDIVTLRDYRLLVGLEHRGKKRHACRLEAGWVFGRAVEYVSGIGNFDPGQTAIIRLSSDY